MYRIALAAGTVALLGIATVRVSTASDDETIVVRVGSASLRVRDVERRLASLPSFQLHALAPSEAAARRRFVESVLVPELLFGQAARDRHLDDAPPVRSRLREVYHRALRDRLRTETLAASPITDEDVRVYYDAHRSDFVAEQRLLLWRILVDDEALARRILGEGRGTGGPERWKNLAREHSRDVATKDRGGVLGFVGADGRTDVPQVRVDPALYAAALAVRDGELVADPVREGPHYAVVWRRGTRPAEGTSVEQARSAIADVLARDREARALRDLIASLRKAKVTEHNPELLEALPEDKPGDLRISQTPAPAQSLRPVHSADPIPRPSGSSLR